MFNQIMTLSNGVKVPQLALGTWLKGYSGKPGTEEI